MMDDRECSHRVTPLLDRRPDLFELRHRMDGEAELSRCDLAEHHRRLAHCRGQSFNVSFRVVGGK